MKTSSTVLVLLAFLTLVPCTRCMAQTPVGAPLSSVTAAGTAPAVDSAAFLASLSGGSGKTTSNLTPTPSFMTGCTSVPGRPALLLRLRSARLRYGLLRAMAQKYVPAIRVEGER
jgi:hypothetical protein